MMQHQYWVTKKTFLKKLGTKEDECVIASDAELDAKLELFRSISDSCLQLQRVLDQYQERLCLLAQEENSLGKFLRDAGKASEVTGKPMVSAGKAISYSGQQRLSVRGPLLRLYHEVETFRCRAVKDMRATVSAMEKARIEYRAALSWMKSTSAQLDPDTGRGLDNFRKAQRQVKESKKVFDKLTLDVLQKIDLLAAARCNMFSHVLSSYQNSFLTFATKVSQTLTAAADTMNVTPHYEFSILKELSQNLGDDEAKQEEITPRDKDQMLFFQDDYKDENPTNGSGDDKPAAIKSENGTSEANTAADNKDYSALVDFGDISLANESGDSSSNISDLAGLKMDGDVSMNFGSFMPSKLLQDPSPAKMAMDDALMSTSDIDSNLPSHGPSAGKPKVPAMKKEDKAAWFKMFAELDPLANPDNIPGRSSHQSHAA